MKSIRHLRKIRGWNQTDLANECGINQATVSKAEAGDGGVSLTTYQMIADALEVPLFEIFMPDTTVVELKLLHAFRALSPERQKGWIDLLDGPLEPLETPTE
ncbi:helix-turn-helix transcriptional regulator [uncultured Pelagimonas sp.]|uniref:helix-turn-helix transcriptional regulator n=1 Tax=uncultured Pelagimonas sp. TaxID=1618102 RepID=UPI00260F0A71|nr:helix-turn-helix transcriptional regulator [uncultured Pelagimonas sp.]